MSYTLIGGRRAVHTVDGFDVQENSASKRYTVACPDEVRARLEASGWQVEEVGAFSKSWERALVCVPHETLRREAMDGRGAYRTTASILLNHTGRCSIRIVPTAVRFACQNSFHGRDCLRVRHDSRAARRFMLNPAVFLRNVLSHAGAVANTVEAQNRPDTAYAAGLLLDVMEDNKPRLFKSTARISADRYESVAGPNLWSVLQSLTDSDGAFYRGRSEVARRALDDLGRLDEFGRVPTVAVAEAIVLGKSS